MVKEKLFQEKLRWDSWSDVLEIGIASIDDDHRHILTLISTLHDAVGETDPQPTIRTTMETLRDYVEYHFRREETMLLAADYPAQDAHRALHDTFRAYVSLQLGDDVPKDTAVLLSYLVNWWVGHIATDDKFYREHVLRHPSAITSADAIPPMPAIKPGYST
jgi:hemerythrin